MRSLNLSIRTYRIKSNWRTLSEITDLHSSKVIRLSESKIKQKNGFRVKRIRGQSVQSLSCVQLLMTPWTTAHQASLSFTNSQSLLKLMSIKSVMPSIHLILCRPLLLLTSIFPIIRVFSNESVLCIRCPKYWSFSISITPSSEYSELISFRIDWFDHLTIQGTVKSILQHHSSKSSVLQHSAFFMRTEF